MNYLETLKEAVQAMHGCPASHCATYYVSHLFNNKVVWEGDVEIFRLEGCKAEKCYAWGWEENGKLETVAVLEMPPVIGPEEAVMAWCRTNLQTPR